MSAPKPRREVQLDPALQAKLLEQMRKEQAVAMRKRALRRYVLLPLVIVLAVASPMMALSDDTGVALTGHSIASVLMLLLWRQRHRLAASLGLG